MTAKAVSLAAELAVLTRVTQGVADFLDADEGGGVSEDHQREAVAMLRLLGARLGQLRRVVVGAQDPKALLAPFNEAEAPGAGDLDIVLRPWPDGATRSSRRKVA